MLPIRLTIHDLLTVTEIWIDGIPGTSTILDSKDGVSYEPQLHWAPFGMPFSMTRVGREVREVEYEPVQLPEPLRTPAPSEPKPSPQPVPEEVPDLVPV